jgi:hypothetical protein
MSTELNDTNTSDARNEINSKLLEYFNEALLPCSIRLNYWIFHLCHMVDFIYAKV